MQFIQMHSIYMICKRILRIFLNEHEIIFRTELNGFKYFNLIQIIPWIICLHTVKWFPALICNINSVTLAIYLHIVEVIDDMAEIDLLIIIFLNEYELNCLHTSIAIVSMQFNGLKYCYVWLTVQLNISLLFTHTIKW